MSVLPILTLGDPRLRMRGQPVDSFGKYLHGLIDDLTQTMRDAPGVGLAAPQLGVALDVAVVEVSGRLFEGRISRTWTFAPSSTSRVRPQLIQPARW